MKKFALIVGMLSILSTSVQAGYWKHTPDLYGGGYKSEYVPEYRYLGNNQWGWE